MKEEFKAFFDDLKRYYSSENREMSWDWRDLESVASESDRESILFYLAFNLSKNVIHGPLPQHLHNRMALEINEFSKAYFNYLESHEN